VKPWPPIPRRVLLVLHVATSVGLMGAVAAFLLLAVLSAAGGDRAVVVSAYPAMDMLARLLILPLAVVSVVLGVLQGTVTAWGLVRHWWVLAKLVLSLVVIGVLLLQIEGVRTAAETAEDADRLAGLMGLRWSFVVHAAGGLAVLGAALVLSVFKPAGRTPWTGR
jgi:hypothetical protein